VDHLGNLVPVIIWGLFVVVAIRRWFKRVAAPAAPPAPARAAAPARTAAPAPAVTAPPPRRRLAPPAAPRPVAVQPFSVPAPATTVATMGETLSAEAAAAFPALDLSLPDTPGVPATAGRRRRVRTIGGGAAIGSPAWAANAIIANEILGTPVGLRPGATVGIPHAF
jgi:hypothetical protein